MSFHPGGLCCFNTTVQSENSSMSTFFLTCYIPSPPPSSLPPPCLSALPRLLFVNRAAVWFPAVTVGHTQLFFRKRTLKLSRFNQLIRREENLVNKGEVSQGACCTAIILEFEGGDTRRGGVIWLDDCQALRGFLRMQTGENGFTRRRWAVRGFPVGTRLLL